MRFGRSVLGLDVGSYSVKAVELRAGFREFELVRGVEAPMPGDAVPEEREAALFDFVRGHQLPLENVIAAMPSDAVTQRHLRLPFSDARRVTRALPFEIEGELPVGLDDLVLVSEQLPGSPDQTDVLVIACPREAIRSRLNTLRLAGIEPRILEAEGAVLANLAGPAGLAGAGQLMLDIGHSKTTLCLLVDDHPVLLRALPIGGAHLERALAGDSEPGSTSVLEGGLFEEASTRARTPAVGAILDRLAREVLRSIQSAVADPLHPIAPGRVILTGGTARAERLDHYLEERLGLPCSRLRIDPGTTGLSPLSEAGAATFAHAAALALRGAPTARVTRINFRQAELSYRQDWSQLRQGLWRSAALAILAYALWIGSLGAELVVTRGRAEALQSQIASLLVQAFPGASTDAPFEELQRRASASRALADHLGVTRSGLSSLEVLLAISKQVPRDLSVVLRELSIEPRAIRARGVVRDFESAGRLRSQLQKLEWAREVRVSEVVSEGRSGAKTFELTIPLEEGS